MTLRFGSDAGTGLPIHCKIMTAMLQQIDDHRMMDLFNDFRSIMYKHGRCYNLPKDTPFEETYAYRHLKRFRELIDELQLSNSSVYTVMEAAIAHAAKQRKLDIGLGILNSKALLKEGYKALRRKEDDAVSIYQGVVNSAELFKDNNPLKRQTFHSRAQITIWYENGSLSNYYIASSRQCRECIQALPPNERKLFPSGTKLVTYKLRIATEPLLKWRIKLYLGNDYAE